MRTWPGGITYVRTAPVERRPHPSGRPIRDTKVKGKSIWRVPDRGAVTPRLRDETKPVDAIGFVTLRSTEDYD